MINYKTNKIEFSPCEDIAKSDQRVKHWKTDIFSGLGSRMFLAPLHLGAGAASEVSFYVIFSLWI